MKRLLTSILILLSVTYNLYAQSGWVLQTSGFYMPVSKVYFVNELTGWASVAGFYTYSSTGAFGRTTNGGNNWQLTIPQNCTAYNDFCFVNDMTGWIVGTCSFDTWPYNIAQIQKTTNSGINFTYQKIDSGGIYNSIYFLNSNTGWVSAKLGKIYKTTNGGTNWLLIQDSVFSSLGYSKILFRNITTGFAVNGNQILKTTNSGSNWSIKYNSAGNNILSLYIINDLFGFSSGGGGLILKTSDDGETWNIITSPTTKTLSSIYFTNINTGYITGGQNSSPFSRVILKSTDSGNTWNINTTSNNNYLDCVYFLNDTLGWVGGGEYYTSSGVGVIYKTTNAGNPIGIQTTTNEIPKEHTLSQNYPNPFNPITKIKFDVPLNKGGERGLLVKLIIYDLLGREVVTLVNGQLKPGSYEAEWDGSNFASGIYFYSLQTENFIQTKKMLLVK